MIINLIFYVYVFRKKIDESIAKENIRVQDLKMPHITTTMISNDRNQPLRRKVEKLVMPEVEALPRMTMWAQTSHSVLVEDATELHNVPYLRKTDRNFIKKLIRMYGGYQHGDNEANLLDDEIFVKVVEKLTDHERMCDVDKKAAGPLDNDQQFPSLKIFTDISRFLSDKGSPDNLKMR